MSVRVKENHTSEKVVKLYHENLSIEQIAIQLNRSTKWVKKALNQFGIPTNPQSVILYADIPYGWSIKNSRLVINKEEQWIIEKIESDLKFENPTLN